MGNCERENEFQKRVNTSLLGRVDLRKALTGKGISVVFGVVFSTRLSPVSFYFRPLFDLKVPQTAESKPGLSDVVARTYASYFTTDEKRRKRRSKTET